MLILYPHEHTGAITLAVKNRSDGQGQPDFWLAIPARATHGLFWHSRWSRPGLPCEHPPRLSMPTSSVGKKKKKKKWLQEISLLCRFDILCHKCIKLMMYDEYILLKPNQQKSGKWSRTRKANIGLLHKNLTAFGGLSIHGIVQSMHATRLTSALDCTRAETFES